MDYAAIEQAALAMSMDARWDLGFLLLDTLDGLSEKDLASALPPKRFSQRVAPYGGALAIGGEIVNAD